MSQKSQIPVRFKLGLIVLLCALPSLAEAYAILWGQLHGHAGKALRDGLDFWAGGFLVLHHKVPVLFDAAAYQGVLSGLYGKLPYHLWSYPPTYLFVPAAFAWAPPWPAILAFDFGSLLLLAFLLRRAGKEQKFILAVLLSPATLENALEHQNAALLTALIGGGLLLLSSRPRLAGALIGLATIKPQLGLVLPLFLLRRAPKAFAFALLSALLLGLAALIAFGPAAWAGFWTFTRPMMSNVLLTGQPPEFAGGLISVFALCRPLGVHPALAIQALVTLACVLAGLRARSAASLLLLGALASPYLHDYDLLGASLAIALLVEDRLKAGFYPFEAVLFFIGWFIPGLLPWMPQYAHAVPLLLALLLASAARNGGLAPCDSSQVPPASPASSAGPSATPARHDSTAPG